MIDTRYIQQCNTIITYNNSGMYTDPHEIRTLYLELQTTNVRILTNTLRLVTADCCIVLHDCMICASLNNGNNYCSGYR